MTAQLWTSITETVMITAFVGVMMIIVEYVSVLSAGSVQNALRGTRWGQYAVAVALGAIPGCLGAFAVVTLYVHRLVPFGAVVAAMIATSGDESFVMLAMFPDTALWLTLGLVVLGVVTGVFCDLVLGGDGSRDRCSELVVHDDDSCSCLRIDMISKQWQRPTLQRCVLTASLTLFSAALLLTGIRSADWNWVRVTLCLMGVIGVFVVVTVPDHFLRDHLWQHVAVRHVPRVFAWTLGALLLVAAIRQFADIETLVRANQPAILGLAGLVGIIPESGPHLVFVTLFRDGNVPLSILVTSSIVQDGHGMLPLLAESRRDFIRVKAVNLAVGICVGAVLLTMGH
jgi:hypothetical protein